MSQALGFAVLIVVLTIFLPDVLAALQDLLLVALHAATEVIQDVSP